MKAWALAVLLMAAILAEKAMARPNEAADEEKDYQEDGQADEDEDRASVSPARTPIPKLKTEPITRTPMPGETVQFPCEVENATNIIWLTYDKALKQPFTLYANTRYFTKDDRFTVFPNHTLQIQDVRPSDSGPFTCKINNNLAVVHRLSVFEPPRLVSVEPSEPDLILQRGESIKFQCNATGFPEPKIVWTRKGRKLPSDHREHRGDHLHFAHVGGGHSGVYVCTVTNDLGTVKHAFNLTISDEPEIEFEKDMINTNLGETAQISCIVHAYPPPRLPGSKQVTPSQRSHRPLAPWCQWTRSSPRRRGGLADATFCG